MPVHTHRHPILEDEVVHQRLSGGLELYICLKPGFQRRHAILAVDYGSADARWWPDPDGLAQPAPHGVAHFLEHRLFEKRSGDITTRFTSIGAEVDAYTTFTSTGYSFTCSGRFDEGLALLLELVLTPHFRSSDVRHERDIITHEIELYEDSVDWVAFNALLRSLYGRGPMGDDIAGTRESVARIGVSLLESCYSTYYRSDRMSLVVAGDLDPDRVAQQVEGALQAQGPWLQTPLPRPPVCSQPGRQRRHLSTALPRLLIAGVAPARAREGAELLRFELCLELGLDILFGPSSDFYVRHYQSGLVDDETFGYEVYCEPSFVFCVIGGDTPEPARLEDELDAQVSRSLHSDLVEEGFERSRRRSWGTLLSRYEEVEGSAAMALDAATRGAGVFDYFAVYDGLEASEVVAALEECMAVGPWGVATVLPRNDAAPPGGEGK